MTSEIVAASSDDEWNEFHLTSAQGTVFSTTGFLEAINVPHEKLFLIDQGVPLAAILLLEPNNSGFKAPSAFTQYQGLALAAKGQTGYATLSHNFKIQEDVIRLISAKYKNYSLCLHHDMKDIRPFQWFNYNMKEHGTFDLSLMYTGIVSFDEFENFEAYLRSIRKVRVQELNKSKRDGYVFSSDGSVSDFINLYFKTFSRQNILIEDENIQKVERIARAATEQGFGKLLFGYSPDSMPCSAVLTLHDRKTAYYMFGANDPEFRSNGVSTALLLHAINEAYDSGLKFFDMVGINSPQRGGFKTSFNAVPVPFYSAQICQS